MAKCINDIVNPNVGASPNKSATDPYVYDKRKNGDLVFADNFVNAIENVTKKLQRTNCTESVTDFFSSQLPKTASAVTKTYDWVSNNANLEQGMQAVGAGLDKISSKLGFDGESISKTFCVTISGAFRTLIFYVDVATKAAFVIFKKIDKLKRKIEKALLEFNSAVRDCLVSVIVDTKLAVNKVIRNVTDFDVLIELGDNCPCIVQILAKTFDCEEDADGNKLTTATEVVNCVRDKFSLNPDQIIGAINEFVDNSVIGNIDKGFNVIDQFIKTTMELLITPFRELIRAYCFLLTEKINVTSFIRGIGNAECLFIYTKENDENGKEFYGMNIIDMINTFKSWVTCFESVCAAFVEDIRNKIKEVNENLRLDDKYWRDVMALDLYQLCIGAKTQAAQPRPAMIREVFIKNQDKGKNVFVGIIDSFKQVGKITYETGTSKGKTLGEVAEALKFANGPESEDLNLDSGTTEFDSGVEENVKSIFRNISSGLDTEPYYEVFLKLVDWSSAYIKSASHISLIKEIEEKNQRVVKTSPVTRSPSTAQNVNSSTRIKVGKPTIINNILYPTYELENDYDQTEVDAIASTNAPKKLANESRKEYYNRWYTEILA